MEAEIDGNGKEMLLVAEVILMQKQREFTFILNCSEVFL